ncbi:hypothetical protein P152DRAFT_483153 [Eremomyces bilateralis CBS 781.70]|uniref:Mediator of RNA polymerase II transcription subunit 9 n=1 Tax=Eremomyces bilateralis CBS 781.70 TaxID=1392243 RepID=A0A6G1G0B7_9PEZI|nr:uncharacterized protein P152DRAFT_483153 [Eremomyces bilateralis CBS 781.70]KAF1811259.1 hypothetical protein P152DRAFT_483153 [Eremomyces bilateralis CBS 781.70]
MTTSHQDSPLSIPPNPSTPDPISSLPNPALFDIIPSLHTLLARILPTPSGLAPPKDPSTTAPATSTTAPTPQTQLATQSQTQHATSQTTGSQPTADASAGETLEIHQLAAATSELKVRLQRARAAVRALPDVERSVEEQEGEIGELEARVRDLRGVLEELRRKALAGVGETGAEDGMEGVVVTSVEVREGV